MSQIIVQMQEMKILMFFVSFTISRCFRLTATSYPRILGKWWAGRKVYLGRRRLCKPRKVGRRTGITEERRKRLAVGERHPIVAGVPVGGEEVREGERKRWA